MTNESIIAFVALIVTLVGSLAAFWWQSVRVAAHVGRLEGMWNDMREAMAAWKRDRERLALIDMLERDIAQLKDDLAEQRKAIGDLWRKTFSHDKHIAVQREKLRSVSDHDLGDTEPPGKE